MQFLKNTFKPFSVHVEKFIVSNLSLRRKYSLLVILIKNIVFAIPITFKSKAFLNNVHLKFVNQTVPSGSKCLNDFIN